MPKMNLEWNVFRYDINARKIETYNVFNHKITFQNPLIRTRIHTIC